MFSFSENENPVFSKKLCSLFSVHSPGIGGGFDSSHLPVVGTFDRFNGLSSNILLTFSCHFDNPQMPWGGAFEQKLSAQFKCPAYARPPPPPAA